MRLVNGTRSEVIDCVIALDKKYGVETESDDKKQAQYELEYDEACIDVLPYWLRLPVFDWYIDRDSDGEAVIELKDLINHLLRSLTGVIEKPLDYLLPINLKINQRVKIASVQLAVCFSQYEIVDQLNIRRIKYYREAEARDPDTYYDLSKRIKRAESLLSWRKHLFSDE